jgi:LysM repeat protein
VCGRRRCSRALVALLVSLSLACSPTLDGWLLPGPARAARVAAAIRPAYTSYVVRPGDTFASIALTFHDASWLIRMRNGLSRLPAPGRRITVLAWPFSAARTIAALVVVDSPTRYEVRPGDSLWRIARLLRTTVARLAAENHLAMIATIHPGQTLILHHYHAVSRRVHVPALRARDVSLPALIRGVALLVRLDPALFEAVTWYESRWRMVRGSSGEIGVVQIMPATAAAVQRQLLGYPVDSFVLEENLFEGAVLLAWERRTSGDAIPAALALYHSGYRAVDSRNAVYIRNVLALYRYFARHPAATEAAVRRDL